MSSIVSRGTCVALLATLPAEIYAQCVDELDPCELALYDASVTWKHRAQLCDVELTNCLSKLKLRSSTASTALVLPDVPYAEPSVRGEVVKTMTVGTMGMILGVVLTLLLSHPSG